MQSSAEAPGAAEQEDPYTASSAAYRAGDTTYHQAAGAYQSPARGGEYSRYDAAYDYPARHEAEYAASDAHHQYPYTSAGQHYSRDAAEHHHHNHG
ncbi:hypothetical protein GGI00_004400, partial [Coemansia sp. RSA 2681]